MTQSSRINLFSSEGSLPPEELGREGGGGGGGGCSGTKVIVNTQKLAAPSYVIWALAKVTVLT